MAVTSGRLLFSTAGDYTHGKVTVTGGTLVASGSGILNEVWDLQGGTLSYDQGPCTLGATNTITISNTVDIAAGGAYYNNLFTINASISGSGKAILNNGGNSSQLQFGAVQNWTGGTDVKGIVVVLTGGSLPAGTVTVYPGSPVYGTGWLRLNGASGLSRLTDLVLLYDSASGRYGTIMMAVNQMVRSLTVNGAIVPAGVYTATDFPDYIVGSGTHTLTVLTPDDPPTAVSDLAASEPQLTSVKLSWTAPWDRMNPGNAATAYDIRYSTAPITDADFLSAVAVSQALVPQAPDAAETLIVTGLAPATTYYFAIKSKDLGDLASDLSNITTADTLIPDVTPPAAITDLHIQVVDNRRLTLAWTATGDNGTDGMATSYDIRMSTDPITADNFSMATRVGSDLVPQAAGGIETFQVTGLTPGTSYYFAINVADETPNWSGLSNILAQATLPPDVTAPATITDLAAAGTEAFKAPLTWTAPGDDAAAGTATRYEIRFSTSEITAENWSSATIVPDAPSPQVGGSAETFAAPGLQPSTTYYFAMKTWDEEGNVSGLSNVATVTTTALPPWPTVTSVTIVEKAGVTTTNYPLTLSMIFKKGDVPNNVVARLAGVALPTQTDVKVRYPDGSVKHAMVSFIIPALQANGQVTIDLLSGGTNCNSTWMTKEQLLASDFEALMAMTAGGQTTNISARQILLNAAEPQYWIKGSIASEFIIRDWDTNAASQLNVSYRVRIYPATGQIRVSTVVENTWINARGNITYDFALSLGLANPQVVFSKTGFTQWLSSRWHRIFWQGTTPSTIQIKYDLPYMISTGIVPSYDTSLVVPESTMSSIYRTWQGKPHDIMQSSYITQAFHVTGGREEIGMYPTWTARYLVSMDNRMREITLNHGDLSGSIPIHFRETDPARSFYRHVISVDNRPTIWTVEVDGWREDFTSAADRFPAPIGDTTTPWQPDGAHQASFACIPYIITGDLYYLEEMYFWAAWDIGNSDPNYRGRSQGLLHEQVRGEAWEFRNVVDAANLAPDGDIEKPYLIQKVNNNINAWTSEYVGKPNQGVIHSWQANAIGLPTGAPETGEIDHTVTGATFPSWQTDFMLISQAHARDVGFGNGPLVDWLSESLVGRSTPSPGWNPFHATAYQLIALGRDPVTLATIPYASWAQAGNSYTDKVNPASWGQAGLEYANSYAYIAHGALANATYMPGGWAAWNWFTGSLKNRGSLNADPTWAFVPRSGPPKVGDTNGDGYVDTRDLLLLAGAWATSKTTGDPWNPNADLNADGCINVLDLLLMADHWGE